MKKTVLLLSIIWPFFIIVVASILYNKWLDTEDFIKYNPTYSPEEQKNIGFYKTMYWLILFLMLLVEFFLIKKHKSFSEEGRVNSTKLNKKATRKSGL